ncbi:MAG: hypothetical protein Q8P82_00610 [bacterium]|nr:hypothetical protein [bacterium]
MDQNEQYQALLTEIIAKQSVILGPDIAILKARNVASLKIDDKGTVLEINDDPQLALKNLVNQYVELSGLIVKNALGSIFAKYPTIGME